MTEKEFPKKNPSPTASGVKSKGKVQKTVTYAVIAVIVVIAVLNLV